ncbi:unnamed protein product [Cylicostephanus goldi]|uniref:Uncharacterized protein n=1 Tax=Cylicostephanus goldi TaxID=71465 RepID=A0A3P6SUH1_CYLGO|nr:unnamed protein product [Cylicostephanus goldi]
MVDVGTDMPPMPLSVAMGGGKAINASKGSTTHATETKKDPKFLYTQDVRQTLNFKDKAAETGSQNPNSRVPTKWDVKGTIVVCRYKYY